MITCRELINFLDDYIAGDLPPDAQARAEEHLRVCPDCVNYVEQYRRTIALGRDAVVCDDTAVPRDVPAGLVKAVLEARKTNR